MAPGNSCVFADIQSNSSNIFLGLFVCFFTDDVNLVMVVFARFLYCKHFFLFLSFFLNPFYISFLWRVSLGPVHTQRSGGTKLHLLEGENLHELFEILL